MLWGLFMKIVIADNIAVYINSVYDNYMAYTDIRPCRAVPHTADKKHNEDIHIFAQLSLSVSAQRNIKIVTKPSCQRNVPSLPEVPDADCLIGRMKIFHQSKAQHLRLTGWALPCSSWRRL